MKTNLFLKKECVLLSRTISRHKWGSCVINSCLGRDSVFVLCHNSTRIHHKTQTFLALLHCLLCDLLYWLPVLVLEFSLCQLSDGDALVFGFLACSVLHATGGVWWGVQNIFFKNICIFLLALYGHRKRLCTSLMLNWLSGKRDYFKHCIAPIQ